MAKTPNLNAALRNTLREVATPATHAEAPAVAGEPTVKPRKSRRQKEQPDIQLIGAHLSRDVGRQLRQIALDEDTDVKALLIEAINTLFKSRGKPQIASDPVEKQDV